MSHTPLAQPLVYMLIQSKQTKGCANLIIYIGEGSKSTAFIAHSSP